MTFKPGDRVRFIGGSTWSRDYPQVRGWMATVTQTPVSCRYLDIKWDSPSYMFGDGAYYFEDFELAAPLTPFEQRVHDYIQRELR